MSDDYSENRPSIRARLRSPLSVVSMILCAAVAAFIAAHDVPPEQRVMAAVLGVLGLAVITSIVIAVLLWAERREQRR